MTMELYPCIRLQVPSSLHDNAAFRAFRRGDGGNFVATAASELLDTFFYVELATLDEEQLPPDLETALTAYMERRGLEHAVVWLSCAPPEPAARYDHDVTVTISADLADALAEHRQRRAAQGYNDVREGHTLSIYLADQEADLLDDLAPWFDDEPR